MVSLIPLSTVLAQNAGNTDTAINNSSALILEEGRAYRNPTEYISFFLDPTRSVDIQQIQGYGDKFQLVRRNELEFGYTDDAIWVYLPVNNSSPNAQIRYLLLETNWMESMQVWFDDGSDLSLIIDQNQQKPFSSRTIPHENLIGTFVIESNSQGAIWLRYLSPGSTALPINIETELSLIQRSQFRASKAIIFYSLMLLFITVATLSYTLFRHAIFPIYACYATIVLVYVMHRDGFTFRYLWPSFPNWNSFASLPLGVGIGFLAILFSRQYLTTSVNYPNFDRFLRVCIATLILLIPYGLFVDEQGAKQMASFGISGIATILLALGIRSWLDRGRRMIFFVAGWLGVVGASLAMVLAELFEVEIRRDMTIDLIRMAMVFDAIMMGFAMAERVLQIRRERDQALTQKLEVLQSNIGLHERLNKLEVKYTDAVELAKSSGQVLADATHDIRQPLFALRSSLNSISASNASAQTTTATKSLEYLEELVDEYLDQATSAANPATVTESDVRCVPVDVVLTGISDMFTADSERRDLRFKVRRSRRRMQANPMVITRIVSNFVANALRYTDTGGVLVGIRHWRGTDYIAVYDTGPGMTAETLERVAKRAQRGEDTQDSDGKGLGLDIALSLAHQHGLDTVVRSIPGRGSVFAVAVQPELI